MDRPPVQDVLGHARALVTERWHALLAAIAIVAPIDAVLWLVLRAVASSLGEATESSDVPSLVTLDLTLVIAWGVLVALLALPMAAATAALADEEDAPLGWLPRAGTSLVSQWLRLALVTAPMLLLAIWAMHSFIGMFENPEALVVDPTTGEPAPPLAFQLLDLLFGNVVGRWTIGALAIGLWFLWAAAHATGRDDRFVPRAPWRLAPLASPLVPGLAVGSAVLLGPAFGKALQQVMPSLEPAATDGGASGGALVVLVFNVLLTAFIGGIAIAWVALFRALDSPAAGPAGGGSRGERPWVDPRALAAEPTSFSPTLSGGDAGSAAHAEDPAAGAVPAPAPSPAPPDPAPETVQAVATTPGGAGGTWWWLQPGEAVELRIEPGAPAGTTPVIGTASQEWQQLHHAPGGEGFLAFTPGEAGWYLLGAWSTEEQPGTVQLRLRVPASARRQDEDAAAA